MLNRLNVTIVPGVLSVPFFIGCDDQCQDFIDYFEECALSWSANVVELEEAQDEIANFTAEQKKTKSEMLDRFIEWRNKR